MAIRNSKISKITFVITLLIVSALSPVPIYSKKDGVEHCKTGLLKAAHKMKESPQIDRKDFYIEFYKSSLTCASTYLGA